MKRRKKIKKWILGLSMVVALSSRTITAYATDMAKDNPSVAATSDSADTNLPVYLEYYENLARNAYIRTSSSGLSISGNTATSTGYASRYASVSATIKITVTLQKKSSSGSWGYYSSGSGTYSGTYGTKELKTTISRGTYRTLTTVTCGTDTISVASSAQTY